MDHLPGVKPSYLVHPTPWPAEAFEFRSMPDLAEIEGKVGQRADIGMDGLIQVQRCQRVCMKRAKHSTLACSELFGG
jgi:hypothetical protein